MNGVNITIDMQRSGICGARYAWGNIKHRPHAKQSSGEAPASESTTCGRYDGMEQPRVSTERSGTVVRDHYDGTLCYAHRHKDDTSTVLEQHDRTH